MFLKYKKGFKNYYPFINAPLKGIVVRLALWLSGSYFSCILQGYIL